MPIHDWRLVDAGLFHAFHFKWIANLTDALNQGGLPSGYFALPEQSIRGPIPDILTLNLTAGGEQTSGGTPGFAVAIAPPKTRYLQRTEPEIYAGKANRVVVRHRHGDVVAVVEIVSPGNKGSHNELRAFVHKTADLIRQDIHVLIIDLFPPSKRDPQGIHKAIWDEFIEEDFAPPADKPLTLVSYDAGGRDAYVEPVAVGDALPEMPLFLKPGFYVPAPLESTYQATWSAFPAPMRKLLE